MIIVSHDGGAFQRVEADPEAPIAAALDLDGSDVTSAEILSAGINPDAAVGFWLGNAWYVVGETTDRELARELQEIGRRLMNLGTESLRLAQEQTHLRAA